MANRMKTARFKILGKFWSVKDGRFMALVYAFGLVYLLPSNLASHATN